MLRGGLLSIFLILFSQMATAEETDQWVSVGKSKEREFFVKKGSFAIPKNKEGVPMAMVIVKQEDGYKNTVEFSKWKVSVDDCMAGYGKVAVTDMGDQLKFHLDYVENGGSIATRLGDVVCTLFTTLNREYKKKAAEKR